MVIALGRLGMREFDLGSDADLLFVIPDADAAEHVFWTGVAERIVQTLSAYTGEGVMFTVAALSPNVWVLAVARLLSGFVFGNTGVMLAMLADVTPRKRLGLAVGIASAGFPLGAAIGPYLGGLVAQGPGIRTLLFADACLSALMGVLLTVVVRDEARVRAATGSVGALLRDELFRRRPADDYSYTDWLYAAPSARPP